MRAIPDQQGKDDGRVLRAVRMVKDGMIHCLSSVLAKARRLKRGEELSQEGRGGVGVARRGEARQRQEVGPILDVCGTWCKDPS